MSSAARSGRKFPQITAICFNHDGSQVAVCPGSKDIFVMNTNGKPSENEWTEI